MSRSSKEVEYNGVKLYFSDGTNVVRVSMEANSGLYVLWKNKERICRKKSISDVANKFYSLVNQNDKVIHYTNKPFDMELVKHPSTITIYDGNKEKTVPFRFNTLRELEDSGKEINKDFVINLTGTDKGVKYSVELEVELICKLFREIYDKDPLKASRLSGIPNLDKLHSLDLDYHTQNYLEPQEVKTTFDAILNCYKTKIDNDSDIIPRNKIKNKTDAANWWTELISITEIKAKKKLLHISQMEKEYIIFYINEIAKVSSDKDYKNKCSWLTSEQKKKIVGKFPKRTWVRHRKGKIAAIFNSYISENYLEPENPERKEIERILATFRSSDKLKKVSRKSNPTPDIIEVEDFQALYASATNLRWKCILALGINAGYTFSEIAELKKQEIDIERGEIKQIRPKVAGQEIWRFAKLHPLTIALMKEYNAANNADNKTDFFFLNKDGSVLNPQTLRDLFFALRKKAKVPSNIKFKYLRKCGSTVAFEQGCSSEQVDLFLGHSSKLGVNAHYLRNGVKLVTPVCDAVTKLYFQDIEF